METTITTMSEEGTLIRRYFNIPRIKQRRLVLRMRYMNVMSIFTKRYKMKLKIANFYIIPHMCTSFSYLDCFSAK